MADEAVPQLELVDTPLALMYAMQRRLCVEAHADFSW
jgi:hypothetical protein